MVEKIYFRAQNRKPRFFTANVAGGYIIVIGKILFEGETKRLNDLLFGGDCWIFIALRA